MAAPELEIFDKLEQGTPEWLQARSGVATASSFKDVMSKGRGNAPSKTRLTYAYQVAGEIITGQPHPNFSNKHTERGHEWEPQIRADYEFLTESQVREVGFIRRGRIGYSPDGLVGDDGALEIKTHMPHILLPMLLNGETPPEHKAQTQGALLVSGRKWIDLVCFWPGLPLYVERIERDEEYIAQLDQALTDFTALVDDICKQVKEYRPRLAA